MDEVYSFFDDLRQTFIKFKEQRRFAMLQVTTQLRCCECGHKKRLAQAALSSKKRFSGNKLLMGCFGFLLLLIIYLVYAVREYNSAQTFGGSDCRATGLYTFSDCEVLF